MLLPGQRLDVLTRAFLDDLQALGRYGRPVPNLHDTAVAGATIVPGGEVVKVVGRPQRRPRQGHRALPPRGRVARPAGRSP